MTTEKKTNTRLAKEKPSKSRMIWGTLVFAIGVLCPLIIPLVVASELSSALKSILSGLLVFGIPELFMLLTIVFFGKAGFNYLKRFISLFIQKYDPADEISMLRYHFGKVWVGEKGSLNVYAEYRTSAVYKNWGGSAVKNSYRLNVSYTIPVGKKK